MNNNAQNKTTDIDPAWAWAPYQPDDKLPWTLARAAHLFRRAAFGPDWAQLLKALTDGPQAAVDKIIHTPDDLESFNHTYDDYENATSSLDAHRAWWLRRMTLTPQPLREKITLFWHNHFAVNGAQVNDTRFMRQYLTILRQNALGSYRDLLHAVTRDPALLIYLDAQTNRKSDPAEHFARRLLETFTLGPGAFSDSDVKAAARAFTGAFVLRGRLRNFPREHDENPKQFLGRTGNFNGDDAVNIILDQPAAARLIVRKLYRELICETEIPSDALLAPLADSFRSDYDIRKLVETILRSNLFFSPTTYRQKIKSPVEFALGIVKALENNVSATRLADDLAALGQNLYHPPTENGWPGAARWIDAASLTARCNLAWKLLHDKQAYGKKLDPLQIARTHGNNTNPEPAARFLLDLFLQNDLDPQIAADLVKQIKTDNADPDDNIRNIAYKILTLPEFQLS